MFGALFSILGPLFAAALAKKSQKTTAPLAAPTVISPQVTQTLSASRKRYNRMKGRQSTLLTGGIFTNPSLLRQGLTV